MENPHNPYAAPKLDDSAGLVAPDELVPAGQGARLLNLIIDYGAQFVISFAIGIAMVLIGGDDAVGFLDTTAGSWALGLGVLFGYYFGFEVSTSTTIGKLVTGTRVVNENGGKPTVGQIAGRTLARIIPFEAFSFLGTPPRGWHDSLTKTRVIKSR